MCFLIERAHQMLGGIFIKIHTRYIVLKLQHLRVKERF